MNRIPKLCASSLMVAAALTTATAFAHDPKEHDPKPSAQQLDMSAMEKDKIGTTAKNTASVTTDGH